MEKRILDKINTQSEFYKSQLLTQLSECEISNVQLIEWIHSTSIIEMTKMDFVKRKRAKNNIITEFRCEAQCAKGSGHEGEQCTRRKKEGCKYCGTHMKGLPHGVMNQPTSTVKEKLIWTEEYRGIIYYVDDEHVYNTEDIKSNKVNPEIIGTCKKQGNSYEIKLK